MHEIPQESWSENCSILHRDYEYSVELTLDLRNKFPATPSSDEDGRGKEENEEEEKKMERREM